MKLLTISISVLALTILQSCSSMETQSKASPAVDDKNTANKTRQVNTTIAADEYQQFSVPEAEIIRELYKSGCLIEEIELNRRKQQMKITCANDAPLSSSL